MENISWLFYKDYFKDINFNYLFESNKTIKEQIEQANTKKIKVKNKILIEDTANNWNDKIIKNPCCNPDQSIQAQIKYPGLISGVGINHEASIKEEFKLGVYFDYTYGVPVVSGSSVKGVLRSAFPDKKDQESVQACKEKQIRDYLIGEKDKNISEAEKEKNSKKYKDIDIEKLRDSIFEGIAEALNDKGEKEKKYLSIYERDKFFDAVIIKPYEKKNKYGQMVCKRILESDDNTPHKNELKDPIPISFIKIASGVTMEFRFDLKSYKLNGKEIISAEKKKELFEKILKDFGVGAKTNVGYGQFE